MSDRTVAPQDQIGLLNEELATALMSLHRQAGPHGCRDCRRMAKERIEELKRHIRELESSYE